MTCLGIWSSKGCHASTFRGSSSPKGPRRLSCLDLSRGPVLGRPSCLNLPGDLISRRLSQLSLPGDLHPDPGTPGSQVVTVLGRISFKKPISFFLFLPVFQMGNNQSTSWQMPLRCILDNWKLFYPLTLRRSRLKFFVPLRGHGIHWGTRNTGPRMGL